jgi:hypothetical protein
MEEKKTILQRIKPRSDWFDFSEFKKDLKEILEKEQYRGKLEKHLHDATFLTGQIPYKENKGIRELIQSDDIESMYLAESIIKAKIV